MPKRQAWTIVYGGSKKHKRWNRTRSGLFDKMACVCKRVTRRSPSKLAAVVYLLVADKYNGPVPSPLRVVNQLVMSPLIGVSGPRSALLACLGTPLARAAFRSSSLPAAATVCGCGHGDTRNSNTSRNVQT
jgi:hypothetical protein